MIYIMSNNLILDGIGAWEGAGGLGHTVYFSSYFHNLVCILSANHVEKPKNESS